VTASGEAFAARRNAARLAAVQALYQMEIGGRGAAAVLREFIDHRLVEEGAETEEVDAEHLRAVVEGVVAHQADIDAQVTAVLAEGWKLSRLDATARAILRAGAFELLYSERVPAAAAIDAYVEIAHAFFEGPEPGFVNAALDALAKRRDSGPDAAN
jgi:N utilization substance protein B